MRASSRIPGCSRGIFTRTSGSHDWADGDKANCGAGFASAQKSLRRGHRLILLGPIYSAPTRPLRTFQSRQRNRIMNKIIWLVGAVVIVLFVLGYFGMR